MESDEGWNIELKPSVKRDLAKLPKAVRKRLGGAINGLKVEPRPAGAKKLAGQYSLYRIRVDAYRIVYSVEDRVLTVLVLRIGDRKEVYQRLGRI